MSNETWSDTEKNILYITPKDLPKDQFLSFADEVQEEAKKLARGFICITDLREFVTDWNLITEDDVKDLKSVQKKLKDLGMENAIRILGNQPKFVIDFFMDEESMGYSVSHVNSLDEAEEILKKMA